MASEGAIGVRGYLQEFVGIHCHSRGREKAEAEGKVNGTGGVGSVIQRI